MGLSPVEAAGSLRLSLGATTVDADVDRALACIPEAVARLRDADPPRHRRAESARTARAAR
jgi:cysteine desulfurase